MVLAGLMIEEKELSNLKELGVKDSKQLSPKQRELIYSKIMKEFKLSKIVKSSPEEIDLVLNTPGTNLNWLEAEKIDLIINTLKPDKVFVDCPSPNLKALKENWNKYPEIFRKSWSSYKEYSEGKASKKQKSLMDF